MKSTSALRLLIPSIGIGLLVAGSCVASLAAEEKTYIGSASCGVCHPSQLDRQSKSGHAQALHRAVDHPLAFSFDPARLVPRDPDYWFDFSFAADEFTVEAFDSEYRTELPIEWAFGSGIHAVTFVTRLRGDVYLEHAFSYYADTGSLDITPGHERQEATTLALAMGVLYKIHGPGIAMASCFECHSTGPVSASPKDGIVPRELGVRCEVCHGPGSGHQNAVKQNKTEESRQLIRNPKRLTAKELNEFCGTCHRSLTPDKTVVLSDPWNVRHQPPYLGMSQCFQKSSGAVSCLTCHDPHERHRRNEPAYYRQKCVGCHSGGTHPPKAVCVEQRPSDCVSCHMPRVTVPRRSGKESHLRFSNHWIGVYGGESKLQPSR